MVLENDQEYEPEEGEETDETLEQFEEELLKEEKSKSRSSLLKGVMFLVIVGAGGFYYYDNYYLPKMAPPPPPPPVVAPMPKPEVAKLEEPAATPAEEAQPSEMAKGAESKKPLLPGIAAKPKEEAKLEITEKPVKPPAGVEEKPKPESIPIREPEKTALPPPVAGGTTYTLHTGLYSIPKNADRMVKRLEQLGLRPSVHQSSYAVKKVVVLAGKYPFRELAIKAATELSDKGFKPVPKLTAPGNYSLEVGAFNSEAEADWLVNVIEDQGYMVYFKSQSKRIPATSVVIEGISGEQRLEGIKGILKSERIEFFVKR